MFKHLVVIHGTAHLEIYRQKKKMNLFALPVTEVIISSASVC